MIVCVCVAQSGTRFRQRQMKEQNKTAALRPRRYGKSTPNELLFPRGTSSVSLSRRERQESLTALSLFSPQKPLRWAFVGARLCPGTVFKRCGHSNSPPLCDEVALSPASKRKTATSFEVTVFCDCRTKRSGEIILWSNICKILICLAAISETDHDKVRVLG